MNTGNGTNVPHTPTKVKNTVKQLDPEKNPEQFPVNLTKDYTETLPNGSGNSYYVQTIPYQGISINNGEIIQQPLPLKLYKKLHAIIKEGVKVGKDGYNSFHKYNYTTEADVVNSMRDVFSRYNLVYDFNVISAIQIKEDVTQVTAQITLIDLDSGESKVYTFIGTGQDRGDKSLYKAYTGLQKYFFMKNLLLATNDDPELDSNNTTISRRKENLSIATKITQSATTNVAQNNTTDVSQNSTTVPQGNTTVNVLSNTSTFPKPKSRFQPPKRTKTEEPREE